MATRYEQLSDLLDRAAERLTTQHDAARSIARQLVDHFTESLGSPNSDAVATCMLPSDNVLTVANPDRVPIEYAVTTDDENTYRFGLILKIVSRGGLSESMVFAVTIRHVMSDQFEVRPFPAAMAVKCIASRPRPENLENLVGQMYRTLSDHFTAAATVVGEYKPPIGFAVVSDEGTQE